MSDKGGIFVPCRDCVNSQAQICSEIGCWSEGKWPKKCPASDGAAYEEVAHPEHYNIHPSGVECIDIIQHMTFNIGTVIKHLWRAGLKPDQPRLKDLRKARQYLDFEIALAEKAENDAASRS